jgi:uncharacterized protein (TIGR02466 family)
MEINPLFIVSIGKVSELGFLDLARKIFADNQNMLRAVPDNGDFNTSLDNYYSKKSDACKYNNLDDVEQLKQSIKKNAFTYLETIGYNIDEFDLEISNLWLNEMKSDSVHRPHTHYGFNLSGTYYIDVPQDSGNILFADPVIINTCGNTPVKEHNNFNARYCTIFPENGDMLFWKSNLEHSVPPAKFEGTRRSISFDILITAKD